MNKYESKKRGAHRARVRRSQSRTPSEKILPRNEFRDNHSVSPPHTAHIYAEQGKYYLCHNITTSPISKRGKKYIELSQNPNQKPTLEHLGKKPYFNPIPEKKSKRFFGKVKPRWKLSQVNDEIMKPYRKFAFDKNGRPK